MMKIATIISYSSYHNAFINRCIEEAKKVSDKVLIASHSHFYDGRIDQKLKNLKGEMQLVSPWKSGLRPRDYHNSLRKEAYELLPKTYDMIFFIDSDEVLEGDRVKEWLKTVDQNQNYKLAHFWYYRDTCYRADQIEEGAVLLSSKTLELPTMNWFGDREREDYTKNWNYKASYQNKVLGHHYSWAGNKDMLMRKVRSWGHSHDSFNWIDMVENEFTHEFQGCPFRPSYTFEKINPYVGFTINE